MSYFGEHSFFLFLFKILQKGILSQTLLFSLYIDLHLKSEIKYGLPHLDLLLT